MNTPFPVPKLLPAAALAVSALVSPLIVQAQQAPQAGMKGSGMDSSMPAGKMDMKSMMKENNEKMSSMAMTGNPDVDFAQMMRIHHQGAIDMAQGQLRDGKDPQLLKMAKEIMDAFLARSGKAPAGAK